ncbi:MAG TPA: SRPBCC family protein [Trichocoleus sp.]
MADFRFVTLWELEAPIETVWAALTDYSQWPSWWPAVRSAVELEPAEPSGLGGLRKFVWQTPLGYSLSFDTAITHLEAPHLIGLRAAGEVEGTGRWELSSTAQGTQMVYFWTVRTTQPWMNVLARLIKPLMEWNHDDIMRQGGKGLARHLGVSLVRNEALPPGSKEALSA